MSIALRDGVGTSPAREYEVVRDGPRFGLSEKAGADGTWALLVEGTDPVQLLRDRVSLRVDGGTTLRISPATWGPSTAELLSLITIAEPALTPPDEHNDWFEVDSTTLDTPLIAVPCWIGEAQVAAMVHDGQPWPVVLDQYAEGLTGETLAHYSWFSESGGAPISWDGGAELLRLNGTLGLDHRWGDVETGDAVVELPTDGAALAEIVATWLCELEDGTLGTAFAYCELDPEHELDQAAREEWEELIGLVEIDVTLNVEPAVQALVLAQLASNHDFAAVKEALERPTGVRGRKLRAALVEFAATGGVLSSVLRWEY